jgi:hypothetical protein
MGNTQMTAKLCTKWIRMDGVERAGLELRPAQQHADAEQVGEADHAEVQRREKRRREDQRMHGFDRHLKPVLDQAAEGDFFGECGDDTDGEDDCRFADAAEREARRSCRTHRRRPVPFDAAPRGRQSRRTAWGSAAQCASSAAGLMQPELFELRDQRPPVHRREHAGGDEDRGVGQQHLQIDPLFVRTAVRRAKNTPISTPMKGPEQRPDVGGLQSRPVLRR